MKKFAELICKLRRWKKALSGFKLNRSIFRIERLQALRQFRKASALLAGTPFQYSAYKFSVPFFLLPPSTERIFRLYGRRRKALWKVSSAAVASLLKTAGTFPVGSVPAVFRICAGKAWPGFLSAQFFVFSLQLKILFVIRRGAKGRRNAGFPPQRIVFILFTFAVFGFQMERA